MRLRVCSRILLASGVLLAASPSAALVLHVDAGDPTCQGASPCFSTIGDAVDAAAAGDTVRIQPGTYTEQLKIKGKNDDAAATEADRILIEADPSAAPGSVVLDPATTQCSGGWAVRFVSSRFVTLRGLSITGAAGRAVVLRSTPKENHGIRIESNRVFGNGGLSCSGGVVVREGNTDVVVANNLIYGNGRNGLVFRGDAGGPHVVVGNTIFANGRNGIRLSPTQDTLVANNVILRNGTDTTSGPEGFGIRVPEPATLAPEKLELLHNLICGNRKGELRKPERLLDGADLANLTPTGSEGAGVSASAGCEDPANVFEAMGSGDPGIDFTLSATSPALDSGATPQAMGVSSGLVPIVESDQTGAATRPADGDGDGTAAFDRGALERDAPIVSNPPEVSITSPANGVQLTLSPVTVSGTAQDADSVVVNGVQATLTGNTWSVDVGLVEGPNAIVAVATNADGCAEDEITVTLDSPPVVVIAEPGDGLLTSATEIVVSGTATDLLGVSSVDVNGVAATLTGDTFTANVPLVDGDNVLTAVATDTGGNTGSAQVTVFRGDPPTLVIDSPADGAFVGAQPLPVTGTFTGSDVTITVNGVEASLAAPGFSVSIPLVEGPNAVVATAENDFGSAGQTISVTLDQTPPVVVLSSPPDGTITDLALINVAGTVSDASPIAVVEVNGTPVTPQGNQFDVTASLAFGPNLLVATATDAAGNEGSASVTVTRQACAPGALQSCYEGPSGTSGVGVCASGTRVCVADGSGFGPCQGQTLPGAEACNGLDDDCDGSPDEGFGVGTSCNTGALGICGDGFLACGAAGAFCEAATGPRIEVCGDGIDQDCDGSDCVLVGIQIDAPASGSVTGELTVDVTGTVDAGVVAVDVAGVPASVGGGAFAATVALSPGPNTLVATAQDGSGGVGTTSVVVIQDAFPPAIRIDAPLDGASLFSDRVTVTGLVDDPVSAGSDPVITVNGIPANVSNGTFMATQVPLVPGPNTLDVVATDGVGNQGFDQIQVVRLLPSGPHVAVISGDGQLAPAGTPLADPLVAEVRDAAGNPLVGRAVVFEVVRNNGMLATDAGDLGRRVVVPTDGSGIARAFLQLGDRSGQGNNRVRATAVGAAGEVVFCASGSSGVIDRIVASSGETQRGAVSRPLPEPFVVRALDDRGNPVAGIPVTLTVLAGGGLVGGASEVTLLTGANGRVSAEVTLGPGEGVNNNEVEARIPGVAATAQLLASGLVPGDPADTALAGVVLDNADVPIPNATVAIDGTLVEGVTDALGQFLLQGVPVGLVHLTVDPTTTSRPEVFPPIEFQIVTVAGRENRMPLGPIRIPALASSGAVVGGPTDVTLTMPGVEGVEMTVFAGSASFADGSSTGVVSINQVHFDKVPMPPPDGSVFQPAWTVQPAGTEFDPPARIQLPNTTGSAAGTIVDMVSFDHTLNRFVSIGQGTVSEDGSVVVSDPGFGISHAGWGGFLPTPPPGTVGENCNCDEATSNVCDFAASQPASDPTKLFSDLQCCVAQKVCEEEANGGFQQPGWAGAAVPKFIEPLLDPNNFGWNATRLACAAIPPVTPGPLPIPVPRGTVCASLMAFYHITQDLQQALVHPNVGCGTTADWDKVGTLVEMCQAQLLDPVSAIAARQISRRLRADVRARCLAATQGRTGPVNP